MLKGLGCDMIEVERIRQALSRPSFLRRVYTLEERAAIARKGAQTAAGFWAAKEAVSKALGTGFGPLAPADVEITHDASGAPAYLINEKTRSALQARGAQSAFLSVTHDGDYAMATVILEG